jgi:hypothetical protein
LNKSRDIKLIKWTTLWAYTHLSYKELPLFSSKDELDASSHRLQIGYFPIKIKIEIKRMKMKRRNP